MSKTKICETSMYLQFFLGYICEKVTLDQAAPDAKRQKTNHKAQRKKQAIKSLWKKYAYILYCLSAQFTSYCINSYGQS